MQLTKEASGIYEEGQKKGNKQEGRTIEIQMN
jgi:hypothetical protein